MYIFFKFIFELLYFICKNIVFTFKCFNNNLIIFIVLGVTMREKKSGALSKVQKIKKRLSHSFGRLCKY